MNATTRRELIAMNSLVFWMLLVIALIFGVIALIKRFA
jgi:preprotein translocase subunit SecE